MEALMRNSPPFVFSPQEIAVLRARPRMATYDWARRTVRLVSGPYKGQLWNPDVAPFARDIMQAFDRRHTRKIFLVQPSQTTKSTIALCCFLAALVRMPDNMGIGMPDQEAVRKYLTGRMAAYFSGIAELRKLLRNGTESLKNYGIDLQGGACVLGMWSGSESTMRAESMPYVLIEEEDAYADPTAATVMEERTSAYDAMQLSKIMRVCRPKGAEEQSSIWTAARRQAEAWCVWEARCPICQEYVRMEHEYIVSETGSRDPAEIRQRKLGRYRCQRCGNLWSDPLRRMALRAGRMTSLTGSMEEATVLAYHIRQWESPLVSLSDILARWWEVQGNPRALQLWDNNVCAQPYKFVQLETDYDALKKRILPDLPANVLPDWPGVALTLSIDMQMDYFVYSIAAHWVEPKRLHIVDYGMVRSFAELEQLAFNAEWRRADGTPLRIWRAALDTGGTQHARDEDSRTMQAYEWLRTLRPGVVFGTKGMSRLVPGVLVRLSPVETDARGRRLPRGLSLHHVNGDAFKRELFWRLAEGFDEEPVTFHGGTTEDYLKQVASERLVRDRDGREVWKRIRANHWLDCLVGHLALEHWQWQPSLAMLAGREER